LGRESRKANLEQTEEKKEEEEEEEDEEEERDSASTTTTLKHDYTHDYYHYYYYFYYWDPSPPRSNFVSSHRLHVGRSQSDQRSEYTQSPDLKKEKNSPPHT
jgi:hypothetical protein